MDDQANAMRGNNMTQEEIEIMTWYMIAMVVVVGASVIAWFIV